MTEPAIGIHEHTHFKLGRAPKLPDKKKLALADYLTGEIPEHPAGSDDLSGGHYGLDGNDSYGVCVPTGFDNFRRMVTRLLTQKEMTATQSEIFNWYKTQNPGFDPVNYSEASDQGMVIQLFLEWLVKEKLILGFAAVDHSNLEELKAASYLFLGLIVGVNLETPQQGQTAKGFWDYVSAGSEWGGHCVMVGAYEADGLDCITWAERVRMTEGFVAEQLDEAWVVILPEHLANPTFHQGFDLQKFAEAYKQITGRDFPAEIPPEPAPAPPPQPDPINPVIPPAPDGLTVEITEPLLLEHVQKAAHQHAEGDANKWVYEHLRKYFKLPEE